MTKLLTLAFLCLVIGNNFAYSARILGIFPVPSISHQIVFRGLTLALNKRGHELVVITPNPVNDRALRNYTEIDMSNMYRYLPPVNFIDIRAAFTTAEVVRLYMSMMHHITEDIFQHPDVKKIYSRESNEKFDLLIVEMVFSHAFYALAARFNVPIIGMTSFGLSVMGCHVVGIPLLSSHPSVYELGRNAGYHLSFWKRVTNFIEIWQHLHVWKTSFIPRQQEIAEKYLGSDVPYVGDIEKNISLVFVNQQASLSHIRPTVPKVIEIGGFHMSKEVQPLPKDLKKFLDDATEGFVYMNLGSNVKSNMMSNSTREDFIAIFSKLPQKILWKFEDDTMPGKPKNVYISKWLPQQAVLAHRNIKAFIYQGGVQSTEEAVYNAVPLIGIPTFLDQDGQVSKMVSIGVARSLNILDLKRNDIEEAVNDVINNKRYKEKMLELQSLVHDRPYKPFETAVWWTEFVIRHKGAPHLQSSIVDDPWYQQFDFDIVAFISIIAFTMIIIFLVIAYKLITYIFDLCSSLVNDKKLKKA